MWSILRAGLHRLPPEKAHSLGLAALNFCPTLYKPEKIGKSCKVMGIDFPNRIGLAAGFDKNGDHIDALSKLGFGFIEVGTITPLPQLGSTQPRLFRIPRANAIVNRMGFNNLGVDYAARHLARQGRKFSGVIGCNIGRNKDTSGSQIKDDYLVCLRKLYGLADYFVINVSSPNTPGLRDLQSPLVLHDLLESLFNLREQLITNHKVKVPLVVKISPDLSPHDIEAMARIIIETGVNGVIATNTTTARPRSVASLPYGGQPGGLSGKPLTSMAEEAVRFWREILPENIAVIGTGGICSKEDARQRFEAKADLIQLYTGLIYEGPKLIADCAKVAN